MTQNERNKLYIACCLLDGKMTISEAAKILSLSEIGSYYYRLFILSLQELMKA